MDLREQLKTYNELVKKIAELEQEKKALGAVIMEEMQGKKMQVEDYTVWRYNRLSIKLSLEEARRLNAVKMEEVVDKEKVKELYGQGYVSQGVSEIQYLRVLHSPT